MCKAIDNPNHHQARQRETAAAAIVDQQQQQPLNDDDDKVNDDNGSNNHKVAEDVLSETTKKVKQRRTVQVGFHPVICNIDEFQKVTDPTEKGLVWYNKQDYDAMKNEIGLIVHAKTTNDYEIQQDETLYCFRGLEFLKLQDDIPSRKERRAMFSKQVMAYQGVVVTAQHNKCYTTPATNPVEEDEQEEEQQDGSSTDNLIGNFCSKLSENAKERALELANQDESEARVVYQQCHLLYRGENGEELCMFGINGDSKRSSLCRRHQPVERTTTTTKQQQEHETSSSSMMTTMLLYNPFVQDVLFSYDTLRRVVSPLFSSKATSTTAAAAV